jgi:hypothetical protein
VYEATTIFGGREVILSENVHVTTAVYLVYDAVLLPAFRYKVFFSQLPSDTASCTIRKTTELTIMRDNAVRNV